MIRAARCLALTWSLLPAAALAAAPADPWLRIQSTNFELFTTAGERAGRDLVRHFEQVRGFFLGVFGVKAASGKPVRIVAFHSEKEFRPYRPNEVAAAFYHAGAGHDYIVISGTAMEHYQVATHEYTHLLLGQTDGTVPLWLNEGLAELYSTIEQAGDRIVVGKAPPGRAQALLNDRWIDLGELLSTTHDYPDRRVELHFLGCVLLSNPLPQLGQDMRWVARRDLTSLEFPAADTELIRMLAGQD